MKNIEQLVRRHLTNLKPYASARHEFSGEAEVYLDANENPYDNGLNRYPDPLQIAVKKQIAKLRSVRENQLFLGNGSDEAIDLLIRLFCEPGLDNILICEPTYGMYRVSASISNVEVRAVTLTEQFQLDVAAIKAAQTEHSKILFLCSPNNPTGNLLQYNDVLELVTSFRGIVVIDEAYIDFAANHSMTSLLQNHSNVVILQTFSKAWGLAGVRLGIAITSPVIVEWLNKIKPPYNVNTLTQNAVLSAFDHTEEKDKIVNEILVQRVLLQQQLANISFVSTIYPSDANFLLVKMERARHWYEFLRGHGVIVRDRSNVPLCKDCLRISIGTPVENQRLVELLSVEDKLIQ